MLYLPVAPRGNERDPHAMDDGHGTARREGPRALPTSPRTRLDQPALPALRPTLDPEPWRPPRVSAGFALGWVLTTVVLGTITAVWLVGMVFSVVLLVMGQGGPWAPLAFGGTGVLLGRGWVGMAQTMRGRLRTRDLGDSAALPPVFASLSPPLQRLVLHTRGLVVAIQDPELSMSEIDHEMFLWLADMAGLPDEDRRLLAELGLSPAALREELVASRQQHDALARERVAALMRPRAPHEPAALARRPDHRQRAVALLARVEHEVLRPPTDPFRGDVRRR